MVSRHMLASLALALVGLMMVGCEKKPETTANPTRIDSTTPTPQPTAAAAGATAGDRAAGTGSTAAAGAGQATADTAAGARDAAAAGPGQPAGNTAAGVKDATAGAGQAAGDTAAGAKDATAAAAPSAKEGAAGSLEKAKAALGGEDPQAMIDKAMKYIKDNKLDDAQTIVDKLDSVRGSLPADWAPHVDQLKSALTTAKNAAGALPGGLPSLSK